MNTIYLEKAGLTKSEAKVYLALLKIGESTAGPIVDEAKITRSKIYDILERLKNKGLVSFITKDSTKYFSSADPSNILDYLDKKELEIEKQKKEIKNFIPELEKQYKRALEKKIAEIFVGIKGMENAFKVLVENFDPKIPYFAFGAGKGENIEQVITFFSKLHLKRIEKKIKSYILFNESSRGLFKNQEKSRLVETRYLKQSTPSAINIYGDYTVIAILGEELVTILIRNKETADSFREYFKTMWKVAKK
jgi:sugar-specific transcriptional regulator TrmB